MYFFANYIEVLEDLNFFPSNANHIFLKRFIEKVIMDGADSKTLEELIKLKFFIDALDYGRMGFLTPSGKGSQNREYFIPILIGKFVAEFGDKKWKEYEEESILEENENKEDFLREGLFERFISPS